MLLINMRQWADLEKRELAAFEETTYAHLTQFFPLHCALLGREQMGAVIQRGLVRANGHGMTPACCVRSYIEFMCLLGSGFDADPLLPWGAEILGDRTGDPIERGDRLYERTWQYLDKVGSDFREWTAPSPNPWFIGELRDIRDEPQDPLTRSTLPAVSGKIEQHLLRLFPAKCAFVGVDALPEHSRRGVERALQHGITSSNGVILVTLLMFFLGNEFDDDPLLPWVSRTLRDASLAAQADKTDRLFTEGIATLRRLWDLAASRAQER